MVMKSVLLLIVVIGLTVYLIRQCRKPHSLLGRFFLWEMGQRHMDLTGWGLSHVAIKSNFRILDVGCGGGRTVARLATMAATGSVSGLDYSRASVAASLRTNRDAVADGRVAIYHGSVSSLPFPDRNFDLVTAVETHFYWPNLTADLREIRRVLKPDGKVVIIAEVYKLSRFDPTNLVMKMLSASYLSEDEHREALASAGYDDIEVLTDRRKGWLCAIGVNQGGSAAVDVEPHADPHT
jgi:SAM-dependent methyltransferase